jgi:hypothetical protein
MKTLIEVRKGDFLYDINNRKLEVIGLNISQKDGCKMEIYLKNHYDRWQSITNPQATSERLCMTGGYLSYEMLYTTEFEAKSARKSVLMAQLNDLKDKAVKAIEMVKSYREKHYDELNIELIDSELLKLKRVA